MAVADLKEKDSVYANFWICGDCGGTTLALNGSPPEYCSKCGSFIDTLCEDDD